MPLKLVRRCVPTHRRLTLLSAALVAGIAAADWQTICMERTGAIADFRTATSNLANGLSAQTSRMLMKLDLTLGYVRNGLTNGTNERAELLQATLHSPAATNLLVARLLRLSGVDGLFILDAAGKLAAAAGAVPRGATELSKEDFLGELRGTPDAQLFIGAPHQDAASGRWVSFLARRIDGAQGAFAGAVVAELSLADLEDFYRGAMPRQRRLTLLRNDGILLVQFPARQGLVGRKVPAGSPWYAAAAAGGSYLAPGPFDAKPVLSVVRPVRGTPLFLEASVDESEVLAGWKRQRLLMLLGGFAACSGVVLLVRLFAMQVRRLAERNSQLDEARRQLDVAISNVSQGICFFDGKQRLIVCNQRYCEIYRLPPDAIRPGVAFAEVVDHCFAAGGAAGSSRSEYMTARAAIVRSGKPNHTVIEMADGRSISVQQQPMPDGGWVATHEDITERRRAEEKISFLARHDVLTGLPNRSMLMERINLARPAAGRGQGFAIMFLDLDRFKAVNDTLGHAAGDALLQEVAERLRKTVREVDTVARLGGDEFVVLQAGVRVPEAAVNLAQRIIASVGAPYAIDGNDVVIGVSIGIEIALSDPASADELLKNADMALYMSKAEGRGTFRFFEPDMDARIQNRHALERDLRYALDRGEFALHYQAIVDGRSGQACGFEALLRWNHPQRGMVGPVDFIPVAEETGLIIPIGAWVIQQACRDAATWPACVHVSVNLSPIQFRAANLVASVRDSLAAAGLAANRLELEITESVLLQSNERNLAIMHEFRASGIGIVMDDFGIGYSSLSYLRQFPFQRIKIDKCFVQDIATSRDAVSVVRAILGLCRDLDIRTIAEGVEDADQLAVLLAEGCTDMQGYLFSRPKPASLLPPMLSDTPVTASVAEAA